MNTTNAQTKQADYAQAQKASEAVDQLHRAPKAEELDVKSKIIAAHRRKRMTEYEPEMRLNAWE